MAEYYEINIETLNTVDIIMYDVTLEENDKLKNCLELDTVLETKVPEGKKMTFKVTIGITRIEDMSS